MEKTNYFEMKRRKNVFSYNKHAQTDSLPSCSPLPFPNFRETAEAHSYVLATVLHNFTSILLADDKISPF
jgi:hypothetical protein